MEGNLKLRNSSLQKGGKRDAIIFITESGYLKIAKSFTDDLAWKVQDALIESYFAVKQLSLAGQTTPPQTGLYKDKYISLLEENRELLHENRALLKAELDRLQTPQKAARKANIAITNEEIMRIYDLERQGLRRGEIAKEVDRSRATVSFVLNFRPALPLPIHAV